MPKDDYEKCQDFANPDWREVHKHNEDAGVTLMYGGSRSSDEVGHGNEKKKKKKPLPFQCVVLKEKEEVQNPFSGEKVMLEPDAVAVYDSIKGAEYLADPNNGDDPKWEKVRQGLDWFREYEPEAYMKLLD